MSLIADTASLAALCQRLQSAPFITVDTEFVREKTYWPVLCLVQVAGPDEAWAIDPLAPGMDLSPLYALMADTRVLKVFHAARQDVEIFQHLAGAIPTPLFDTQVAAMVCGFGDSVSYETLASQLAHAKIDKSLRFTDWAARPLTGKQLHYALSDVTHLRPVYEKLKKRLERDSRAEWLVAEMAVLTNPKTYCVEPDEAWHRLKPRSSSPRFLMVLKELAAWREREAQDRDLPRQRVIRDEALMEIAAQAPTTADDLARTRGLSKGLAEGRQGTALLEAVAKALAAPESAWPEPAERNDLPRGLGPVVDLLKVLLKLKCDEHDVAQKLVASSADIEAIAADDDAEVPALQGWRRTIFGEDALRLKHGNIGVGLAKNGKSLRLIPLE
ncbi:ribonuclease D [Telmatospirillum siberiense]|uniref:Ribonuclease D n=1 Tax=Telmatospirillum siberiense TaxID=382514 RepID=A0A2N3PU98_9PROT|nr:ribonuclease D [Telmatospirillum siberiense]PKU23975.1 ribonuclease D [Telmatospirillum siberiense]